MIFYDILNSIFIVYAVLFSCEAFLFTMRLRKGENGEVGLFFAIVSHIPAYAGKLLLYYRILRIWALIVAVSIVACILTTKCLVAYLVVGIMSVFGGVLLCRASLFCNKAFEMIVTIDKYVKDTLDS